jgi:hypothetical protein
MNNPTLDERAIAEDAVRIKIMDLVQYVSIRGDGVTPLSPYQQLLADLAAKYGVPSPMDRFEKIEK